MTAAVLVAQRAPITSYEATVLMALVSALLVVSGAMAIWAARKAARGDLGPNGWIGIRTGATRSSEAAWLAAHRAAERLTIAGGVSIIASTALALVLAQVLGDQDPDRAVRIWSGVITVGTVVLVAFIATAARRGHRAALETRSELR